MAIVTWDNSLSVNITKIDNQHKKLVDMINNLYNAMSQGKGVEVLRTILMDMVAYTKEHFTTEEDAMKKYSYPDYDVHKMEHTKFVSKAKELVQQFNSGNTLITNETITFLKDWLVKHIKGNDLKYSSFFQGKAI
jgi:hemerythrin